LGNPIGLFNSVSSGVADIFYEPYNGLVTHGSNREIGFGIARGAGSFVKKTVFGVSDSVSKVTGSIGKGLSAVTLDQEFQTKRQTQLRRNRPRHALYGVSAGASSLVSSVASGFEGLARKPFEGAEAEGAAGFFKGFGKGIVGVVTKPVVGLFDFASNVTEGIRNTTTVFDMRELDRIRLPRFIASDGILRPYSEREALGQSWLQSLDVQFATENYVAHLDVAGEDDTIALLTETRILMVRPNNQRVVWDIPLTTLQSISLEPSGILTKLRDGKPGPFLAIPEQSARLWFFRHLERVVKAHNAQRTS